jgi:DNA-binding protein Fis
MGYDWLEDGTIRPRVELPITKESIYDEMCRLLTDYEDMNGVTENDLYEMLVKIQNNWETVITAQEEN